MQQSTQHTHKLNFLGHLFTRSPIESSRITTSRLTSENVQLAIRTSLGNTRTIIIKKPQSAVITSQTTHKHTASLPQNRIEPPMEACLGTPIRTNSPNRQCRVRALNSLFHKQPRFIRSTCDLKALFKSSGTHA